MHKLVLPPEPMNFIEFISTQCCTRFRRGSIRCKRSSHLSSMQHHVFPLISISFFFGSRRRERPAINSLFNDHIQNDIQRRQRRTRRKKREQMSWSIDICANLTQFVVVFSAPLFLKTSMINRRTFVAIKPKPNHTGALFIALARRKYFRSFFALKLKRNDFYFDAISFIICPYSHFSRALNSHAR